MRKAYLGISG
ncbi:hypothetical protein MJ699_19070 [Klebsiella pneumoniae]|nr:hypothetical protein MJ699_19070 [Klebsiella pneumoniae]